MDHGNVHPLAWNIGNILGGSFSEVLVDTKQSRQPEVNRVVFQSGNANYCGQLLGGKN